jgi:hypothetical protein
VDDEWMGHFLAHAPPHLTSLSVRSPVDDFDCGSCRPLLAGRPVATEEDEIPPLALRHLRRLRLRLYDPTQYPVHPSLRFAITNRNADDELEI